VGELEGESLVDDLRMTVVVVFEGVPDGDLEMVTGELVRVTLGVVTGDLDTLGEVLGLVIEVEFGVGEDLVGSEEECEDVEGFQTVVDDDVVTLLLLLLLSTVLDDGGVIF